MNEHDDASSVEFERLLEAARTGKVDYNTCMRKIARRTLEQDNCDLIFNTAMAALFSSNVDVPTAVIMYLLHMHVLRLEDDVRVLRAEMAKERAGRTDESRLSGRGGASSADA